MDVVVVDSCVLLDCGWDRSLRFLIQLCMCYARFSSIRDCIRSLVEGPIYSAIGVVYIHSCNARASYPELCTWLKIRNMRRPDTVSRFSFTIFLSCHGQKSTNLRFIRWNMARSFEYKSSQQLEVISTCNLRLDLLTHVIEDSCFGFFITNYRSFSTSARPSKISTYASASPFKTIILASTTINLLHH